MSSNKVSVIVPVYNTPSQFIRECIKSIDYQTYPSKEIIIVDDGSSDGDTISYLNSLNDIWEGTPNRVITQRNYGVNSARKKGVDNANGELVTFVDSDDIVSPTYLSRLVSAIETKNHRHISVVRFNNFNDNHLTTSDSSSEAIKLNRIQSIDWWLRSENYSLNKYNLHSNDIFPMVVWGKLFHKKLLKEFNWSEFNYSLAEDEFFSTRLYFSISGLSVVDTVEYYYRRSHDDSRSEKLKYAYDDTNRKVSYLQLPLSLYSYQKKCLNDLALNNKDYQKKIIAYTYEIIVDRLRKWIASGARVGFSDYIALERFIKETSKIVNPSYLEPKELELYIWGLRSYILNAAK